MIEPAREAARVAVLGEKIGDVLDQPLVIDLAESGRRLAHQHGAGAEGLEREAERGKLVEGAARARSCASRRDRRRRE